MQNNQPFQIKNHFDAVVMFTWSNWFTEPISNRYHYSTRFAKILPVIFVQPDCKKSNFYYEDSGYPGITILHIPSLFSSTQRRWLDIALEKKHVKDALFWVYNSNFSPYIRTRHAAFTVYHATEDYVSYSGFPELEKGIRHILQKADLVVAVSQKVLDNYDSLKEGDYSSIVLPNGCDFDFWSLKDTEQKKILASSPTKLALYQGGINYRLDYTLIERLAGLLPQWQFVYCGDGLKLADLQRLSKNMKNIIVTGPQTLEQVREWGIQAAVGIIPFEDSLEIHNSLPLKSYEYLALGLPVVSVDIQALQKKEPLFFLTKTAEEFATAMEECTASRSEKFAISQRLAAAKEQDYNLRFSQLLEKVHTLQQKIRPRPKRKVNILYDENSMHVFTIKNYLNMFERYSEHEIHYSPATSGAVCPEDGLEAYDSIAIFYSIRMNIYDHLSPSYRQAMMQYQGYKILFVQDDYDTTEVLREAIEDLRIDCVYTVVPQQYINQVYPQKRFPETTFISILTGYLSDEMVQYENQPPIQDRHTLLGYRGRNIGYWYGDLAQEKLMIGIKMRDICDARGLAVDIEWTDAGRIYSEKWLDWLSSCKATLGTESGANVFDDKGTLRKKAQQTLAAYPDLSYEEYKKKYLSKYKYTVVMNQISPKVLEAVCLKTALVLFEGTYSGIVKPHLHFIPLKKDFSNIDEVLAKLQDDEGLQQMVDRAYLDITSDETLYYKHLIHCFDSNIIVGCAVLRPPREALSFRRGKFHLAIPHPIIAAILCVKYRSIDLVCRLIKPNTRLFTLLQKVYLTLFTKK